MRVSLDTIGASGAVANFNYFNFIATTTAPAAPSGLVATAASSTQINLAWTDNSGNEDGFKIERSTDGANFLEIATVGANVTTYADTGRTAATAYYYRARSFNIGGNSGYSNVANATTLPNPPAAPSVLAATAVSSTQINLTWTDNASNEDGFKIERSTDGSSFSQIATAGADASTYSDTGLAPAAPYYYRVRAFNAGGNSAYSNTTNATTPAGPPATPSGLTATSVSKSQINLKWTDNASNETGFKIERSTNGTSFTQIAQIAVANQTTYSNTGLLANKRYYYRVRSYNAAGDSAYSNTANAKTKPK
jgi:fibronectin type 3 domain-containing protein